MAHAINICKQKKRTRLLCQMFFSNSKIVYFVQL